MPKIVDHDARRRELLDAVVRVLAQDGIEGATTRALARETGWSTGALAHYFPNKADILAAALEFSHERIKDRWARDVGRRHGLDALRALLLDNLPLDERRRVETRLEMVFWSQALGDPRLREIQRAESRDLRDRIVRLLDDAAERGELAAGTDPVRTAERLLAFVDGLSAHHVLYPDRLAAADLTGLVEDELSRLRQEGLGRG